MRKELLEGLTDEQIKKVEACKSSKEVLELAKEEGVALTDEQLEAVSGGCWHIIDTSGDPCPNCGSTNTAYSHDRHQSIAYQDWTCHKCGYEWHVRV